MKNEKGEIITSRKRIADVFGEFYKKFFNDNGQDESKQEVGEDENESSTEVHNNNTEEMTRIPEITTEELRTAINKLKKGKSPDSNGIRAEDTKARDDETREMVRQIFNEIVKRKEFTPEDWKKVKIKVIRKKGDVKKRCRNCSRQYCTADCIHDLTKKTSGRSGWIPDNRPPGDVQND